MKLDFKIAMVCHFKYSEATEYRDKGELKDQKAFERMLETKDWSGERRSGDFRFELGTLIVEDERGITPKRLDGDLERHRLVGLPAR